MSGKDFSLVGGEEKDRLLKQYWTIPIGRLIRRWCWLMQSGGN